MSWSIGLHFGEHFADVVAHQKDAIEQGLHKRRIFYSQMSPESALTQLFADLKVDTISKATIFTNWPLRIASSNLGGSAAMLMTAGFENWLEMSAPIVRREFNSSPSRHEMPIDRELILGVSERINAEGHIEKLVDEAELEFLAAKLEMHKIKTLAVCFMHSAKNNENEKRAKAYFEGKGFRVYVSSRCSPLEHQSDEKPRFWAATLSAYVAETFFSRLKKVQDALAPYTTEIFLGQHPIKEIIDGHISPLKTTHGYYDILADNLTRTSGLLYAGLEEFAFFPGYEKRNKTWPSPYGPVAIPHATHHLTRIQPLITLGSNFHSPIAFDEDGLTYDPGPMVFGRGLTPTFFDILALQSDLVPTLGITEKFSDRGRSRLAEQFSAYSRTLSDDSRLSGPDLATLLFNMATEMMTDEIRNWYLPNRFQIIGPLANVLAKPLQAEIIDDEFLPLKLAIREKGII